MKGMVTVVTSGLLSTLQDLGRPGLARLGVSACGAADSLALRIANRLAGNPDTTAAIEMTLLGGTFQFESAAHLAVAGADMEPSIDGRPMPSYETVSLAAGAVLRFGAARSGARTYLAVRGGFELPPVLGSVSTHLDSRLGGLQGRALRAGDRLPLAGTAAPSGATPPARSLSRQDRQPVAPRTTLRITEGAQATRFADATRAILSEQEYRVTAETNRMGLRLEGALLPAPPGSMLSEGMPLGALQVPPGGQPVILFVDHQTTGGYPVIAAVVSADLPHVGQLRPRDTIRFEWVTMPTARSLLRDQESWLQAALPPCP